MLRLISNPWAILTLCLALAGAGTYLRVTGYNAGYAASEAKNAEATRKLNDRIAAKDAAARELAAKLVESERNLDDLARDLADDADTSDSRDLPGLAPDLLRGIDAIR